MPRRIETQGELVVDARKTVEFDVSENDVSTGKALKSRECPGNNGVCRALKAVHPSLQNKEIRVHLSRTFIRVPVEVAKNEFGAIVPPKETGDHVWLRFQNADQLKDEVYKMDRKDEFKPGKYALYAPATRRPRPKSTKPRKQPKAIASHRSLKGVRKWGINR
jgi:hypothetical protein